MNKFGMKFVASGLIVAMTMVACRSDSAMLRPSASTDIARLERQALRLNDDAHRALREGDLPGAMDKMEQAVEMSPRDAGFRLLLGDIYLKSGRFDSARATYADVLDLDPGNIRAGMNLALILIALGRPAAAVGQLDDLHGRAKTADLGLAYALAGLPERGIELIEPEARSLRATPRVRQNLALAYALAGDWRRARSIASQDLSPADVPGRMQQWAAFVQPGQDMGRIAGMLGVTPATDPGQPARLALRREGGETPALAAVSVESAPVPFETAPLVTADASITLHVGPEEATRYFVSLAPVQTEDRIPVQYASAARALVLHDPAIVRASAENMVSPVRLAQSATPGGNIQSRRSTSQFVVQIGAFSTAENAERAWVQAERRFGLVSAQPLTTTIDWDGRVLHRVSVAGFGTRGEAATLCESIRARGGDCFVRETAGDAPVRWAARYVRNG